MCILICDDDDLCQTIFQDILEREGYNVHCVSTGEQALDFMKRLYVRVVLLDLSLPDKSGHEILKEIKSKFPDTQVIVLTGYATVSMTVTLMRDGAYHVMQKPGDIKQLIMAIETAFLKISETSDIQALMGPATDAELRDNTSNFVVFSGTSVRPGKDYTAICVDFHARVGNEVVYMPMLR